MLVVGVIAAVTALGHRGADPAFVDAQRHPARIGAEALSQAVVLAREPRPGNRGPRGRSARCRAGAADALGNPWRCTVRFASGRSVRYRIRLSADGAFHGAQPARRRHHRRPGPRPRQSLEGVDRQLPAVEHGAARGRAPRPPARRRWSGGAGCAVRISASRGFSRRARASAGRGSLPAAARASARP